MNINEIKPEHRETMVGAFRKLRDEVIAGRMNVKQFLAAQRRVYRACLKASK